MPDPTPWDGVLEGLPSADYHAAAREPGVASSGGLRRILRSPAHYLVGLEDDGDSKALAFGRAVHCAVLEPVVFGVVYAVPPSCDRRTKAGREEYAAWSEAHPGVEELSTDDDRAIRAIRAALLGHRLAAAALERPGRNEVTVRWTDAATGLRCQARADRYLESGLLVDLKTTRDARPKNFARSASDYGYAVQDAHYRSGFLAAGLPVRDFLFVVVESAPPHAVVVYRLDPEAREYGERRRSEAMDVMAECLHSGHWPGYGREDEIQTLTLPRWSMEDR